MSEIAYEAWSRVEAKDMTEQLPSSLACLTSEQLHDLHELLASSFAKGIDAGMGISDFYGEDLMSIMEAYNAGLQQGKQESGDQ